MWIGIATLLLAFDYLNAPIPLTALDRPPVYERLAAIEDEGAVIDVPFGIGDGLTVGRGSQERRLLYHATIHGHPVVGGYIGRMPPGVAQAYESMPVVGNLLRLSGGEEPIADDPSGGLALQIPGARHARPRQATCATTCVRRSIWTCWCRREAASCTPCRE